MDTLGVCERRPWRSVTAVRVFPYVPTEELTVRQKVRHLPALALVPIVSLEVVDEGPGGGVGGHASQVRVRLHFPLGDVVVDIGDLQLHLV